MSDMMVWIYFYLVCFAFSSILISENLVLFKFMYLNLLLETICDVVLNSFAVCGVVVYS